MSHILVPLMSKDFVASATSPVVKAQSSEYSNLTVLYGAAGAIEWSVYLPIGGKWHVHVLMAAAESRPCELTINGTKQPGKFLEGTTGGWTGVNLKWFTFGPYEFKEGANSFRVDATACLPHLKMFIFSPEASLVKVEAKNLSAQGSGISPEEGTHKLLYGWSQVSFIQYRVNIPKAGKWFLHALAAATGEHPYSIRINGQAQPGTFTIGGTGSYETQGLAWHSIGPFALNAGEITLRLDYSNWSACFREFIFGFDASGPADEKFLIEQEKRMAEQERQNLEQEKKLLAQEKQNLEQEKKLVEQEKRLNDHEKRLLDQEKRIAALEAAIGTCSACEAKLTAYEAKLAALTTAVGTCGACNEKLAALTTKLAELTTAVGTCGACDDKLAALSEEVEALKKKLDTPPPPPPPKLDENKNHLEDVEGIGLKTSLLFAKAGIYTYEQLAATPVSKLKEILNAAGKPYSTFDPSSWPEQARYIAEGAKDKLAALKAKLRGGRAS